MAGGETVRVATGQQDGDCTGSGVWGVLAGKGGIPMRTELDFQVENQPRAAYIGRTALVCVEECVHSVMFLKKQLQA